MTSNQISRGRIDSGVVLFIYFHLYISTGCSRTCFVVLRVSVDVMKHHDPNQLGIKSLFQLTTLVWDRGRVSFLCVVPADLEFDFELKTSVYLYLWD